MKCYTADIEGDGLGELTFKKDKTFIRECKNVWLLVLKDYYTKDVKVYRNNDAEDTIAEGWRELCSADVVVGHNFIQYDMQVLRRLYGRQPKEPKVFDTLVAARLLWPDAKHHPYGGNGLENLSLQVGVPKTDYEGDWEAWTQLMEDYCIQDVHADEAIFDWLKPKLKRFKLAFRIETRVAEIIADQIENGVTIDIDRGEDMIDFMNIEKAEAYDILNAIFPPVIETMKTPQYYEVDGMKAETKKDLRVLVKEAGVPIGKTMDRCTPGPLRTQEHPFNPGSAMQIASRLKELHDWDAPMTEPTAHYPEGQASVTEEILLTLEYPEVKHLLHYQMAEKRLQHLADWITRARESRTPGRIHPNINTNGCNTSRMSHSQPNQTACPKVINDDETGDPIMGFPGRYGFEMRSLWGPREGWLQVGGDASGLEIRMLGASLDRWDGGAYAKEAVEGDIHTLNMIAGKLLTRSQSKTVFYAYLYGSGDKNLGLTIALHPSLNDEQRQSYSIPSNAKQKEARFVAIGKLFRRNFESKLPALGNLIRYVKQAASEKGYLILLDGRHAPSRSEHSALNTLMQGNGSIVCKLALMIAIAEMIKAGYVWGIDYALMLNAHDEMQGEARPEVAEPFGKIIAAAYAEAGRRLKVRCPLAGEYKVGKNWAMTH